MRTVARLIVFLITFCTFLDFPEPVAQANSSQVFEMIPARKGGGGRRKQRRRRQNVRRNLGIHNNNNVFDNRFNRFNDQGLFQDPDGRFDRFSQFNDQFDDGNGGNRFNRFGRQNNDDRFLGNGRFLNDGRLRNDQNPNPDRNGQPVSGTIPNESRQIFVRGGNQSWLCQATRFGACELITAGHCVEPALKQGRIGDVSMDIKGIGFVKVSATLNPSYFNGSRTLGPQNDSAVLKLNDQDCQKASSMPLIPLSTQPIRAGDEVYFASRLDGLAYASKVNQASSDISFLRTSRAIVGGDSGGGIFRKRADGTLEIAGIVSTRALNAPFNGGIAANNNITEFARSLASNTSSVASSSNTGRTMSPVRLVTH